MDTLLPCGICCGQRDVHYMLIEPGGIERNFCSMYCFRSWYDIQRRTQLSCYSILDRGKEYVLITTRAQRVSRSTFASAGELAQWLNASVDQPTPDTL